MTAFDPPFSDAASLRQPKVFVRVFSTPPGLPWDQRRAARLEAIHGAPVPISELTHQLRRLGAWGLGSPGRYAVFYVRSEEFLEPFESTVDVDGAPTTVAFGSRPNRARGLQAGALLTVLIILAGGVLGAGITLELRARVTSEVQLTKVEAAAAKYLQKAKTQARSRLVARALQSEIGASRPTSDVLADLAWVSAAKAADAKIEALHWDHGVMAVEARGEAPPFIAIDRTVERSKRTIRSKTWLWGVGPQASYVDEAGSVGP